MKTRLLALTVAALLAACSSRTEEQLLAAATKRLAEKDAAGASIELKNLLQQNPENPRARHLLGKALLEAGDLAGAEIELRRAWELGAPRDELAPLLAQTLLHSGQSRKVIGEFADQSLAEPAAMAALQGHLALAYLTQGNLIEAKGAASRALSLAPESESAVLVGARVRLASRLPDEALEILNQQLGRTPNSVKALTLKAEVLASLGRREEVAPLLEQVLQLDPTSYEARSTLLRAALSAQKLDEAARLVDGMPEAVAKKPMGRFMQAQLALARGDAAKTRDLSQPLLKAMPNYPPLLRVAAGAYQQLGQIADAENLLSQALKLSPDDIGLRRQYANLQLQARAPAKALEVLRPLLESGKADAETLLVGGKAQLLQGNFPAADELFGAAAKLRPDDAKTQAALALTALARESSTPGGPGKARAEAAVAQLRELAGKDSGNSYDLMLVSALMRRQELPAALAAIDKLSAKMTGSPIPDTLRARIHMARKEPKEAQAAFEAAAKADPAYLPAALGLAGLEQQAGRGDAAVKRLEAFVANGKQTGTARLALAELLSVQNAPAERIDAVLAEGVRQEPSEAALRLALIEHRGRTGNGAGAAQAAQEAATALPDNADVLERLARSQIVANDRAQALKSYSRLTTMAPTRAFGFLGLAQLRFVEQDLAGAEREVKRALEAEPGSQSAQRLALQLGIRQGRYDETLTRLRTRQKERPTEAFGFIAESELELARQRSEPAVAALRKAAALAEPGDAPVRLFAALLAAKKQDEAQAFEAQWAGAHPKDTSFTAAAADVLLARGDLAASLSRYEILLKLKPDALAIVNNVAWLRAKLGKPGAVELAERGLKLAPDFLALRDTYATVLAGDKQFPKAISQQRQLLSEFPDNASYRLNLAQILLASGDKPGAKTELESLAKLGPKFGQQATVSALLKGL